MALKDQGTLPLCCIFSFHLLCSTEPTMPFPPFYPLLIQNSKLSSKETHSRPNCIAFPCFLLSVTLSKEAYISHELSQENGSQKSIFWLTFLLTKIHSRSSRSGINREAWVCFPSLFKALLLLPSFPHHIVPSELFKAGQHLIICQKNAWLADTVQICAVNQVMLFCLKPSLGSSNSILLCLVHRFT